MIDSSQKITVDSDGKKVKDDEKKKDTVKVPKVVTKEK